MITHVILDLDGTLYEGNRLFSESIRDLFCAHHKLDKIIVEKIFQEKYKEVLEKAISEGKVYETISHLFDEVMELVMVDLGFDNIPKHLAHYNELRKKVDADLLLDITPRPNAIEFLKYARDKNLSLIVFSGGANPRFSKLINRNCDKGELEEITKFKHKQIEILGMTDYVDGIFSTRQFGGWKPEKEVFEKLVTHLSCKAEDCLMVGDTYYDVAAKAVGMKTVLIGNTAIDKLDGKFVPDYRINYFKELIPIVDELIE